VGFRGQLWIDNDLHNAISVTQVDEYQTAVVAAAMYPASEDNLTPGVSRTQLSTVDRL
jgi:hypothetical protein